MVKVMISTNHDIQKLLEIAFKYSQAENKWDEFYRTHPGFEGWVEGNNPYSIDSDLLNLKMMEILEYMDCDCWCEGGIPSEWDTTPEDTEWKEFMEA